MNNNINDSSSGNNSKSRALLLLAVTAVVLAFASFSANAALYFPLLVCAAAVAFLIDILKSPVVTAVAVASAFGVAYLITKDLAGAVQTALVPLVLGLLFVLCRRRSLGLFKSSLILGGAAFALFAAATAVYIYGTYGDLISGAKTMARDLYDSVIERFKNYISVGSTEMAIAENELKEFVSLMATLLPGIAAALLQFVGAATYLLTKLFYRIFGKGPERFKGEYRMPENAIIFFAFSLVLSLILSLIKSLRVAHLAAVNLCIALAVPTLIDGGRRIVSKFRNPPRVTLPDGREVKRPPVFLITVLAMSLFFSFIAPFAILAFYSVFGTVREILSRSAKKKEE